MDLSSAAMLAIGQAEGINIAVRHAERCEGAPDADAHVHLSVGFDGELGHYEAVSLDESAPCRAEVESVLRCLRPYLKGRQWSGRSVGEVELHSSARNFLASRGIKHAVVDTHEANCALTRLVAEMNTSYPCSHPVMAASSLRRSWDHRRFSGCRLIVPLK